MGFRHERRRASPLLPGDDVRADMDAIRAFYADKRQVSGPLRRRPLAEEERLRGDRSPPRRPDPIPPPTFGRAEAVSRQARRWGWIRDFGAVCVANAL
jgi:hypothetical protein